MTSIEQQRQIVRLAYAKTNSCNVEYEREFRKLHEMNVRQMAYNYRKERGLPPNAKTPYCE